jgi:hypothetical protein
MSQWPKYTKHHELVLLKYYLRESSGTPAVRGSEKIGTDRAKEKESSMPLATGVMENEDLNAVRVHV